MSILTITKPDGTSAAVTVRQASRATGDAWRGIVWRADRGEATPAEVADAERRMIAECVDGATTDELAALPADDRMILVALAYADRARGEEFLLKVAGEITRNAGQRIIRTLEELGFFDRSPFEDDDSGGDGDVKPWKR